MSPSKTAKYFGIFTMIIYSVLRLPMKNSRDPRWVGAWWVGFLGCAIASLFISMPIMVNGDYTN
jgi:hypothetical protein